PSDMTGVPRSIAEHRLNIREGCPSIRQKKRGQAPERTKAIQAEVQKLIEARIMREVYYHDWLSNPVMVKKHDGSWRMCVDFTDLNKACPQDFYPLPKIDWNVESLSADEEKTAFHTGQGVYCYTKMPFGLKNAGATYQRLMDKAFESQMGRNIEVYVDDLVIKSHTEAEMVRDIEETFQTLRKINMKLNPKKCSFGLVEGVFLGYVITPEGIKPCPDKTTAVLQLPSPQTIKEVQSLNGKLASLNRTSVPAAETTFVSSLSVGRTQTTGRADHVLVCYSWSHQCSPDDRTGDGPDASLLHKPCVTGSGTKLLTDGKTGFITSLCSKKTSEIFSGTSYHDFLNEMPNNASQGVSVTETQKEPWTLFTDGSSCVDGSGAGIILTNLDGVEFTYALRFQFAASNNEAEYEALIAGLQIAMQMRIKNIQANVDSKLVANQVLGAVGTRKQTPLAKSRQQARTLIQQVLVEELETKSITGKEVTAVIEEEGPTWMTKLVNYLKEGILPGDEKEARKIRLKAHQYELMEGILYKRSFLTPWLRCAGPLQAEYVMKEIQEGSCSMHAGPRSVVTKAIRLEYFWPTMHKEAQDMIRECSDCQIYRPITRHPQQPLTPITAPWPFYKWGIDIAGPFPEGPGKVKFLIVAMDYFTKWIEAKAVATITGGQVKKFVWDNIVCRFGIPGEIISDNGKQFADNPFKDWCDKLNITQHFISIKHPQSNGLVEKANRSLGEDIKACLGEGNKNWVEELPHILWAYRTMIKSSHCDTPFSLTYGTKAVIPAEIGMPTYRTTAVDVPRLPATGQDPVGPLSVQILGRGQTWHAAIKVKVYVSICFTYSKRDTRDGNVVRMNIE
nr:reverse transcriptase domain-containing protein [Tanacetum cinerariifolium]